MGGNRNMIEMLEVAKISQLAELSNSIQETGGMIVILEHRIPSYIRLSFRYLVLSHLNWGG